MSAHGGLWTLWPEEWNVGGRKAAAALSDARKVNMQFAKKHKDRETKRPNGRTDEKADEHLPLGIPRSVAMYFFPGPGVPWHILVIGMVCLDFGIRLCLSQDSRGQNEDRLVAALV